MNNTKNYKELAASYVTLPVLFFVLSAALTACGGGGGSSTPSSSSTSPTAASSTVLTAEDTPASDVLQASDPEGDPLTFNIASIPSMGTAVITDPSKGAYVYTPDSGKSGTDSFTFKANDGTSDSNTATVTITVTAVNDAPVAGDASLNTNEGTPLTGTLLASDLDDTILSYSLVSNGSLGNAVITNPATGAFTYTPDPDKSGTDSFTFKASDGASDSNTATVTVIINAAPIVIGSCGNTPQPKQYPLPNGESLYTSTLTATDPESDPLTYSLPGGSTDTFLITAKDAEVNITDPTTGSYTYKAKSLADGGDRGLDSFSFQVTDPDGATSTATETVVVNQTIMPLGDSITVGDTDVSTSTATTVGYRKPLHDSLNLEGIGFDFVGTEAHGTAFSGFDLDHEGHGGWTASELLLGNGPNSQPGDGVYGWLDSNRSDFILLHAGTNGLDPNGDDFTIELILEEIDQWESDNNKQVTVLLALIIDQAPTHQDVTDFNQNVLDMADTRISNGDDIIIVYQQTGAGLIYELGVDMAETLHPNANGYAKMANTWLSTLTVVLDQCP